MIRSGNQSIDQVRSKTFLVGAGVVGQAILQAHIQASKSVCLVDQSADALRQAIDLVQFNDADWEVSKQHQIHDELFAIELRHHQSEPDEDFAIVIESISERLDVKQQFFQAAESLFGTKAVFCTNTSTLRISDIAAGLECPENLCGMHFFMPVDRRSAVEIVRSAKTSSATVERAQKHVLCIDKQPFVVADSPGFVVNRLLSPYLNEAMLLLTRGIDPERIERAALDYGMPMSPLELIDWIGTRTVFDAGRAFWQAFPKRIDPSPLGPALLKSNRNGRAAGAGFYDYHEDQRSESVPETVRELIRSYTRQETKISDAEVQQLLTIPMWIEAALAADDGVVSRLDDFEFAMKGGLGFDPNSSWIGFFDALGSEQIVAACAKWSGQTSAMRLPTAIERLLRESSPSTGLSMLTQ